MPELVIEPRDTKTDRNEDPERDGIGSCNQDQPPSRRQEEERRGKRGEDSSKDSGPQPPYQAATIIAGKNCRYGTLPPNQARSIHRTSREAATNNTATTYARSVVGKRPPFGAHAVSGLLGRHLAFVGRARRRAARLGLAYHSNTRRRRQVGRWMTN